MLQSKYRIVETSGEAFFSSDAADYTNSNKLILLRHEARSLQKSTVGRCVVYFDDVSILLCETLEKHVKRICFDPESNSLR